MSDPGSERCTCKEHHVYHCIICTGDWETPLTASDIGRMRSLMELLTERMGKDMNSLLLAAFLIGEEQGR